LAQPSSTKESPPRYVSRYVCSLVRTYSVDKNRGTSTKKCAPRDPQRVPKPKYKFLSDRPRSDTTKPNETTHQNTSDFRKSCRKQLFRHNFRVSCSEPNQTKPNQELLTKSCNQTKPLKSPACVWRPPSFRFDFVPLGMMGFFFSSSVRREGDPRILDATVTRDKF
jgi:hypothetical protein